MKPKLLYIGMQYDYGDRRRGLSYEHRNFYDSLECFCRERGWTLVHYDFMERGGALGQEAMTEELLDLATATDFAYLFAVLFDPSRDPFPEVFSRIGESGRTRTVHWFCDDHWKFETHSRHLAPHFDLSCTTAQSALAKYAAAGLADRVLKTQWACNHHLYVPCSGPREIDVSFVGMAHGNRRKVLAGLAAAGIAPEVFGFGWKNRPRLPFHRMVRLFSRSRINLNLSNASAGSGQQIKGRNFEIPGTCSFQLSANAENLSEYFTEDREIAIFRSETEMVDKVRYFLAHETEREAIARKAYERTLAEHTWQHRLAAIFNRLGAERTASAVAGLQGTSAAADAGAAAEPSAAAERPLVSVVIPCYNHAAFLPEAVASVLAQTYPAIEIIVVNDGSPDDTSAVARKLITRYPDFSISLIEQQNAGLAAARNAGVAASKGTYWLPLDADDKISPHFLEKCVPVLENRSDIGFVYTDMVHFGALAGPWRLPEFDADTIVHKANIACVCSLVRRQVWEDAGGYNEQMKQGYEDWDFWVSCIEKGWQGFRIPEPLFYYRKHRHSMLNDANRRHDLLTARIVLNHPALYRVEEIQNAALTIQQRLQQEIPPVRVAEDLNQRPRLTVTYLIHSILGVTGGNQTLIRQANALCRRGHRVNIVTYSQTPSWFDFNARIIRVPAGEPMAGFVPRSDVVIATYFLNAPELLGVSAPVRIYFAQGDQYIFGDDTPLADPAAEEQRNHMRRLCAESYQIPGVHFVANSYNLAATVQFRCGRQADGVIPACTDQDVYKPMDRRPPPPWRILVVGPDSRGSDLEPLAFKGIGEIRSALEILAERGDPIQVVRMSNTAADIFRGYPCEFHFKPADRQKTNIFGTAHILVYASHYDSCPLPPMEAMSAGAAVVCTATPGALEYCRHEENCLLVPVGSPEAIAGAVHRIMNDQPLMEKIVAGGLATAAEYPQERQWDVLEQLLNRFLDAAEGVAAGAQKDRCQPESTAAKPIHKPPGFAVGDIMAGAPRSGQQREIRPVRTAASFRQQKKALWNPLQAAEKMHAEAKRLLDGGDSKNAVAVLERIIDGNDSFAPAHNDLGALRYQNGDMQAAAHHYKRAVEIEPANPVYRKNLADFYCIEQGRIEEALRMYVDLLAVNPQDVDVLMSLGLICTALERPEDARHFYNRVLETEPWNANAREQLENL